jgi:hypothetical protein
VPPSDDLSRDHRIWPLVAPPTAASGSGQPPLCRRLRCVHLVSAHPLAAAPLTAARARLPTQTCSQCARRRELPYSLVAMSSTLGEAPQAACLPPCTGEFLLQLTGGIVGCTACTIR